MPDERTILAALRSALMLSLIVFGTDPRFRAPFVQALSACEDALGVPRTCPRRDTRRSDRLSLRSIDNNDRL